MTQRIHKQHQINLGEKELTILEEIEKIKPEWRFFKTSQKAKELFWKGAEEYINRYSIKLE